MQPMRSQHGRETSMSACPNCKQPGEHVGVTFTLKQPGGVVLHQCGRCDYFQWEEPVANIEDLLQQLADLNAAKVPEVNPELETCHVCNGTGNGYDDFEGLRVACQYCNGHGQRRVPNWIEPVLEAGVGWDV